MIGPFTDYTHHVRRITADKKESKIFQIPKSRLLLSVRR